MTGFAKLFDVIVQSAIFCHLPLPEDVTFSCSGIKNPGRSRERVPEMAMVNASDQPACRKAVKAARASGEASRSPNSRASLSMMVCSWLRCGSRISCLLRIMASAGT